MMRVTLAPRNGVLGAVQRRRTGDAGHDAVAACDYTTALPPTIPQSPCPRCAYTGPHCSGPGAGPHYQRLLCGACGAFLRWLPKPRSVRQEGQP